jgi:hypothetical protein
MEIRDKRLRTAIPFLPPGEPVQAVFCGQTANQYLAYLGGIWFFLLNRYRIVVVTSQRMVVLDTGKMSMAKCRSVVAELPRSTRLGPPSGMWHVIEYGDGQKLRVHRKFFKVLTDVDATAQVAQ